MNQTPFTDIRIKAITGARINHVTKISDAKFEVKTRSKPENGSANQSILGLLAEYFSVSSEQVVIIRGQTSPNKTVRIYTRHN